MQRTPTRTFPNSTPPMAQGLKMNDKKLRQSFLWGAFNMCLVGILYYDVSNTCPVYISYLQYAEYCLILVFGINTTYHFISCYRTAFQMSTPQTVAVKTPTSAEKTITRDPNYSIINSSPFYTSSLDGSLKASFPPTPINTTALSWRSNVSNRSFNDNLSQNYSVSPSRLSANFSQHQSFNSPASASPLSRSRRSPNTSEMEISDAQTLSEFLKGYELQQPSGVGDAVGQQPTSLLSTFWNHPVVQNSKESPSFFKKCQYQLAQLSPAATKSSPSKSADKNSSNGNGTAGLEMWRRFNVDSIMLTQWNENLRTWISQTILERLVREFDTVDELLQKHNFSDVKVGAVGLDRLRKIVQIAPGAQFFPTLSTLIPFLELTPNQEYLVKRIHELSQGGCMSDFKWSSGGSFNDKPWDSSLPTDCAIIMHLFATYMDTQLLPLPNRPDVKPFTGYHYIRAIEKVPELTEHSLAIHQLAENPPHYGVIVGEQTFEMVKGYNNMIHSLLLFLYQVNKREQGMLRRVNLGQAGVNILWVIEN